MDNFVSRAHGFTGWINSVLARKSESSSILNSLMEGNTLQLLLESMTGQPQTRIQSMQGLTDNQKVIRVDWFISSLKKAKLLPNNYQIESKRFAQKSSEVVFTTLAYLILYNLIGIRNVLPKFLQPSHPASLIKSRLTFSAQEDNKSSLNIDSLERLSLDIINRILRNDKYTKRLQLSDMSGLADSRVLCAIINTFIPGTFTAEVLLSDRWTISLCLEGVTKALRTNFLMEVPDLLAGDEWALSGFVAALCIQGVRYRQETLVRERAKRLVTLLKENKSQLDLILEAGPVQAEALKLKTVALENNLQNHQKEYKELSSVFDLAHCDEWHKHVVDVQLMIRNKILKQMDIRFDQIDCPSPMTINEMCEEFAINLGLTCNIAFYRPVTKETIWPDRKLVLYERSKGLYSDNFTGQLNSEEIYKMLGLPPGKLVEISQSKHEKKYNIFVSSSTRNKKLPANAPLLYQVFPGTRAQCEKLLHRASRVGEIIIVEKLITFFNSDFSFVNSKDSTGNTALHYASKNNNIDICELLLQNGANVNICNSLLQSPFYLALDSIQKEAGLLLLENCVNPDLKDRNNKTAIDIVRNVELKRIMLDKKNQLAKTLKFYLNREIEELEKLVRDHENNFISLRSRIYSGMTLLHIAAKYNISGIIRVYSDIAIDINLTDAHGKAPLHYVTNKQTAELLLECGADPNAKDFNENTVLHSICSNNYSSVEVLEVQSCVSYLLKFDVSNLYPNTDGLLPIHMCAIHGNDELMETLLEGEQGQELEVAIRENTLEYGAKSPLYHATVTQRHSCVATLLNHGLLFYTNEPEKLLFKSLAQEFVCSDLLQTTQFLITQGVDMLHTNRSGNNALHLAVQLGTTPVLEILIDAGANVNQQNKLGESPLFIACRLDNDFAAAKLLENACDYTLVNKRKRTAFDYIRDHEQWIKGGFFKDNSEILARLRAHSLLSARDLVRNISKTIDKSDSQRIVHLIARSKTKS
ncbi:Ankyrin-3 [Oopsacas minuta]|uniref:Ankyrin-3 n=1 Tax=Oopsacas minuta TaxID=111878 RepID=A0AAV7JV48_9METZ|nr:Ankyrin-3 [Oopsacas minuta]